MIKHEEGVYYCKCGSEMDLVGAGFATVCQKCWNVFSFKDGWHNGLEKAKQLKKTIEIDKIHYIQLLSRNQLSQPPELPNCSFMKYDRDMYQKRLKEWEESNQSSTTEVKK